MGLALSWLLFSALGLAAPDSPDSAVDLPKCAEIELRSGVGYKPHCQEELRHGLITSQMAYNAEGLRDKDYSSLPKPGWKRILYVGSTRMAGPGLTEAQTPPRLIEKYLGGAKNKVEVINAGVEGYSPLLEVEHLQQWIDAYHPTHVVLNVEFESAVAADMMLETYAMGSPAHGRSQSRFFVHAWARLLAKLFGWSEDKPDSQKKILTLQSSMHRLWRSWKCRVTSFEPGPLSVCLAGPSMRAMESMAKIAERANVKFVLAFSLTTFSNNSRLARFWDQPVYDLLNRITPSLEARNFSIANFLKSREVPEQLLVSLRGNDLFFPQTGSYNPYGADLFARGAALRLKAFVGN